MEDVNFNSWTVKDLKEYLLQYDIRAQDIKGSGKNGNVIKKDLLKAANKMNKKNNKTEKKVIKTKELIFPPTLTDVFPHIAENLDATTVRLINKEYYSQYPIKTMLYHFIVNHFDYDSIENMKTYFETYDIFLAYQKYAINTLDDDQFQFLIYYMYLINNHAIEQMDKDEMRPYQTVSFIFHNNDILLYTNYSDAKGKIIFNKEELNYDDYCLVDVLIRVNFTQDDFKRMGELYYEENDLKTPTYKSFDRQQSIQVSKISNKMLTFLKYYIKLIQNDQIKILYTKTNMSVSGFIFLNNRLVVFNER